jgi:hypothetical protein
MSKHHKDSRLVALQNGLSINWTVPEGGDLASMRNAYKHGQLLTFVPVTATQEIQVGDIVYVKWHNGYIVHLVQEIRGDQFLIANSLGKINGWVNGSDIIGRVTKITNPEPRPSTFAMVEQLETAYRQLIAQAQAKEDEALRLLSVIDDLYWYAKLIGAERWDRMPRSNKWSFEQNLWYFTKRAKEAVHSESPPSLRYFIAQGKECVGLAAEIFVLLEYDKPY